MIYSIKFKLSLMLYKANFLTEENKHDSFMIQNELFLCCGNKTTQN